MGKIDGQEAARIMYGGSMSGKPIGAILAEGNVRDVLHHVQKNIAVGKSRYNKFGNYNYRNAEDIIDAVKNWLPDGASLKITDEMIMLGNRFYIKATAILLYKDDIEEACGYAREQQEQKGMSEPQITGAASSYARKYALNGLFAIDDGVDADSQDNTAPKVSNSPKVEPKAPSKGVEFKPPSLTPEQKLAAALKKSEIIIKEYKDCKDIGTLADVQTKYHSELKRFNDAYPEIFTKINEVGMQVIESFN